jgi:hypothetical protein
MAYADCSSNRWDSWFDLIQPLSTTVPWYVCSGNHEIEVELLGGFETFKPYSNRFRMPWIVEEERGPSPEQTKCCPSSFVGKYDFGNAFYSFEHGPATIIFLNSYTDSSPGSVQYNWLESTLEGVDRDLTPWVFVLFHSPIYNSNSDHQNEDEILLMKASMEDIFTKYRVNAIFSGHVHAYERSYNVLHDKLSDVSPMYVVIGDGGNREGHAGDYISDQPPIWSAFRDNTVFGYGRLEVMNKTHSRFEWMKNRNETLLFDAADGLWLENQYYL